MSSMRICGGDGMNKHKYCKRCEAYVLAHKDERKIGCMAHIGFAIFTFIATVLTGGIFGIPMICIWMLCAFYDNSKFLCSHCGEVCK